MSKKLVEVNRGSLVVRIEETAFNNQSYALVPKDYYAIDRSLKETKGYRKEIEIQLKHSDTYLKARKFIKEKLFRKRVTSKWYSR